jgi:hypothetical protein
MKSDERIVYANGRIILVDCDVNKMFQLAQVAPRSAFYLDRDPDDAAAQKVAQIAGAGRRREAEGK